MKLSERIKMEAFKGGKLKPHLMSISIGKEYIREILSAVEAAEEGRVLPELPEYYVFCALEYNPKNKDYCVAIKHLIRRDWAETGIGPTPALAAQAAIDKLNKDDV